MRFSLLFALLLILPLAHSLDCVENATLLIFSEQGTLIVAVIILTILIIIGSYLVGIVIRNPVFTVFAKDELYHFAFSLAILFGFSVILYFACASVNMFYTTTLENIGAGSDVCFTSSSNMTKVSLCYLGDAKRDAQRMSESYVEGYISKLMASTWTTTIAIPLMNSYTMAGASWRRVDSTQFDSVLNMFIFPALISLSMQELFIGFISENIIAWLLPIALLLRIFIPTRQMGNMLIALAIGLYIVIPFIYTFNYAMYGIVTKEDCLAYGGMINDAVFGNCLDSDNFWNVARLMPQAFFLPNLAIALLITFLAGVNKALRVIG